MAGKTLSLKLTGRESERELVQLEDFYGFCKSLLRCLRISEMIVSGHKSQMRFLISDMELGSVALELDPIQLNEEGDYRDEVVSFFEETVVALEEGAEIDARLRHDDLEAFGELAEPVKKGLAVSVGEEEITLHLAANVERLLKETIRSEGSVSGRLDRINVHSRNEFILFPAIGGSVTCTFPESLLESVGQAVKRHVTVYGTLLYEPDSALPKRVHAKEIKVHPRDDELPTLHDVRHLGKWNTGGKNAVEFVRSLRDDEEEKA